MKVWISVEEFYQKVMDDEIRRSLRFYDNLCPKCSSFNIKLHRKNIKHVDNKKSVNYNEVLVKSITYRCSDCNKYFTKKLSDCDYYYNNRYNPKPKRLTHGILLTKLAEAKNKNERWRIKNMIHGACITCGKSSYPYVRCEIHRPKGQGN